MFDGFEEELDLPSLFVDFGDGGGTQVKAIGEEFHFFFLLFDPYGDPAEFCGDLLLFVEGEKLPSYVSEDVGVFPDGEFFDVVPAGVAFEPCDEADSLRCPLRKHLVVVVAAIHDDERAFGEWKLLGNGDVGNVAFGDDGVVREVAVMVEQQVHFRRSLGGAVFGPVKYAGAEL